MADVVEATISNHPSPLTLVDSHPKTPKSPFSSAAWMMTPLASPVKKAITSMQTYLEEVGHLTKLDPQDSWLPITESRNGNAYYAAFHTLSSGIGFQALLLPLAFTTLGWAWGTISLVLVFIWQLYTLWLLIQLHESVPGTRYSRYLSLSIAAFGIPFLTTRLDEKEFYTNLLRSSKENEKNTCNCLAFLFQGRGWGRYWRCFQLCTLLSTVEWYIVFVLLAAVLVQLPNLNSIAGVSLIGAVTAVTYCTLIWVLSVSKTRPVEVSYNPVRTKSEVGNICSMLNALGIIAFAFRGHNLVLEIQGTMPSTIKNPSSVPMWKGVKFSYMIIACCLFPMAIGGYWAYGNLIPVNRGLLDALDKYHRYDTSNIVLGLTSLFVVINCLTSFQIYAMPALDNLEFKYTSNKNRPCPRWLRTVLRLLFCCLTFFIAVAFPFLQNLAGLIGGIALPVTLAYPCLIWIRIKKPQKYSSMWWLNWCLGSLGMIMSALLVFGAIWNITTQGIPVHFFKP